MTELEKKVYDAIVKKMDIPKAELANFDENTPLFDGFSDGQRSMGLDSLDSLELVVLIYDKWNVDVPVEDMKKLISVKAVANYIEEHST